MQNSEGETLLSLVERQRLINKEMLAKHAYYFWSDGIEVFSSTDIDEVPSGAWHEPSKYPDIDKWETLIYERKPAYKPEGGIVSSLTNHFFCPEQIERKAMRLATLEWRLKFLAYLTSPAHNKPNSKNTKLMAAWEQMQNSALSALVIYKHGAYQFLNDFFRYGSASPADILCAHQFEIFFARVETASATYSYEFTKSSTGKKGGRSKTRMEPLHLFLREKLSEEDTNGKRWTADALWALIPEYPNEPIEIPGDYLVWRQGDRLHTDKTDGVKSLSRKSFSRYFTDARKKTRDK